MNVSDYDYAKKVILNADKNELLTLWCGVCEKPIGVTTREAVGSGHGLSYVCQPCYAKHLQQLENYP